MNIKKYNNQKIGISIITYNRQKQFTELINTIKNIDYIDYILIIKDKNINYGENDPQKYVNNKIKYLNLLQSKCIAQNKNIALKQMIKNGCRPFIYIIG